MADDPDVLRGLRVLVVEDSLLVSEVIADTLESCGCTVVGPIGRLHRAIPVARDEQLNGAVLDVNLAGELCFPIAWVLAERGVPFLFLTGYGDIDALPPEFTDTPVMRKPFVPDKLVCLISERFRLAA
jgi:DNA-binding response OmpR family regulator